MISDFFFSFVAPFTILSWPGTLLGMLVFGYVSAGIANSYFHRKSGGADPMWISMFGLIAGALGFFGVLLAVALQQPARVGFRPIHRDWAWPKTKSKPLEESYAKWGEEPVFYIAEAGKPGAVTRLEAGGVSAIQEVPNGSFKWVCFGVTSEAFHIVKALNEKSLN